MIVRYMRRLATYASLTLGVSVCLGAASCGSDDDSAVDSGTPVGGAGSGAGQVGSAGSASGNAGSGEAAAGSAGMATALMCGRNTCTSSLFTAACCTTDGSCGLGTADECLELNQEGILDRRCADQALIAFGMVAKGCCKASGKCGLMFTRIGLGCVERTAIPSWASSGNEWTATDCSDADAGI
jgi:hypothetical protein